MRPPPKASNGIGSSNGMSSLPVLEPDQPGRRQQRAAANLHGRRREGLRHGVDHGRDFAQGEDLQIAAISDHPRLLRAVVCTKAATDLVSLAGPPTPRARPHDAPAAAAACSRAAQARIMACVFCSTRASAASGSRSNSHAACRDSRHVACWPPWNRASRIGSASSSRRPQPQRRSGPLGERYQPLRRSL